MIHVSMLLYARDRLPAALQVSRFLSGLPEVGALLFVINGSQLTAAEVLQRFGTSRVPVKALHHDNVGAEFGGYQKAADVLLADGADKIWLFNDTVGPHQFVDGPYLRDFARAMAAASAAPLAAGRVVQASERLEIDGLSSGVWLQSHILGMDRQALQRIGGRIHAPELDALIQPATTADGFFSPRIGSYLRAHLTHWLFGQGEGTWYKASPLTAQSAPGLALKARSILQELSLSMRLEQAGIGFMDQNIYLRRDLLTRARCVLWNKTRRLLI